MQTTRIRSWIKVYYVHNYCKSCAIFDKSRMVGCGPPVFLQHGLEGSSALWYYIQDLKRICYIILVFLTLRSWHRNVLSVSLVSFLESITAVSTLLCAKTKPSLCRLLPGPHRGSLAFMLAEGVGSKQYQLKTTAWGMECWF